MGGVQLLVIGFPVLANRVHGDERVCVPVELALEGAVVCAEGVVGVGEGGVVGYEDGEGVVDDVVGEGGFVVGVVLDVAVVRERFGRLVG